MQGSTPGLRVTYGRSALATCHRARGNHVGISICCRGSVGCDCLGVAPTAGAGPGAAADLPLSVSPTAPPTASVSVPAHGVFARSARPRGHAAHPGGTGPVLARSPAAGDLLSHGAGAAGADVPVLPLCATGCSTGTCRIPHGLRPRSADHHLCADDRGQGPGNHRRPQTAGRCPVPRLAARSRALASPDTRARCSAERFRQQHAHRGHAVADSGQRIHPDPQAGVRCTHAHGPCHAARWYGDHHRHFDESAGGVDRPGPRPAAYGDVRFHLACPDRRHRRGDLSVAGGAATATRAPGAAE